MAERKAILSNRLYVPRDQILPHHFREFTYDLYDSFNKQEFRVETFQLYPDHYGFCRGDIGKLQRVFPDFDFDDRRSIAPFPYKLKMTKELRPNQAETLSKWIGIGYGMLQAPARWGKTVWMSALVKKLKQRALMLAHVEELCHQLEETFREFTNINELEQQHGERLCGVLNEWDDFFPILTLSTYQCFESSAVGRQILSDKRDFFGLVMVDECHRAATEVYTKVVGKLDAMYRVGVTATPTRKDNMHCIASDMLGPVRVIGVGEQLHVDYEWVYTNTEVREFSSWGTMWGRLCKAKRRNTLIAKRIVADVRNGRFVLCTTERLAHIDDIRDAIVKLDPDISIAEISGRVKGRDELRKAIKRGEYQVTIAMSKIIELGYNIPRWSTIHATLPMTNQENWYQRISRIRTPMEPAFEGDIYEKPVPLARIYIDTGHKAIWAYKATVKKVNDKFDFTCLNPDKPREKSAQPRPKKGFAGMKRPGED